MSDTIKPLEKSTTQWWILIIVAVMMIAVPTVFICKFELAPSGVIEHWGQFGDYFGGTLNPIIGFITVWLLIINLKHTRIALRQADLALQDARSMQKATEVAFARQIEIADESRDVTNTMAIWKANEEIILSKTTKRDTLGSNTKLFLELDNDINALNEVSDRLTYIIAKEIDRLCDKHVITTD